MTHDGPDLNSVFRSLSRNPPKVFFIIVAWLVCFLQRVLDVLLPPPQRVLQKSLAFVDSHIILLAVKLGIADALGDKSASVDDLAEELGKLAFLTPFLLHFPPSTNYSAM